MSCVRFTEHPTRDGHIIGEIYLNSEKSLNALTLEMIDLIQPQLDSWRDDARVVAVLLDSAGEKGFCAGGDIVNLYKAMVSGDRVFPEQFFTREYRLDYSLHAYPKPTICWGSGIVMGGGMGLMNGCSHRIVTETSHLAMPEVGIGLYPDVGGSWFLNRMPGRTGLFLGLTGNPINAVDALFLGLADHAVRADARGVMMDRLLSECWGEEPEGVISRVLTDLEEESRNTFAHMPTPIRAHEAMIREVTDQDSVEEMVETLLAMDSSDTWLKRAQKTVAQGSPLSIKMIHEQLARCRHLSLKEVFQQELILSVQCSRHRELQEGIRALLIDKDGQPEWTFASVDKVDVGFLAELFKSPWTGNPLADL